MKCYLCQAPIRGMFDSRLIYPNTKKSFEIACANIPECDARREAWIQQQHKDVARIHTSQAKQI